MSPQSTTLPLYFCNLGSNSEFLRWQRSINDAKWTFLHFSLLHRSPLFCCWLSSAAVSCTSNWLEQMFHFQNYTRHLLRLILSPQDLQQSLSPETNPVCNAVQDVRSSKSCQVQTFQDNLWANFWQFSNRFEFFLLDLVIIQARTWDFVQLLHFLVCQFTVSLNALSSMSLRVIRVIGPRYSLCVRFLPSQ